MPRGLFGWLLFFLLLAVGFTPASAQTPTPEVPPGFFLLDSALGVTLYKKNYPNGNPDYVQLIDLSEGARLSLLHGEIKEPRTTRGDYGGPDPRLTSLPIETYWQQLRQAEENAFCLTNGLFFYMPEYPTRLAFPLKVDGVIVADGWGKDTYVGEQLLLELWDERADIVELSEGAFSGSTAPNVIGGLTEEANKRAKFSVGRTFVGVDDRDADGIFESVLIFNTISALQSSAADVLRSFGADKVMMLDGGGSTQLICESGWHIRSDRPLPQAIGVIAADEPPVSGEADALSDWSVSVEGEKIPIQVEIQNTGLVTWTPKTTAYVIQSDRLELAERLAAVETTAPGEPVVLDSSLQNSNQVGIMPLEISLGIEHKGKLYDLEPIKIQAVVLPPSLQDREADLLGKIKVWESEHPDEVDRLVSEWIDAQMSKPDLQAELPGVNPVRTLDVTLIPLLMLPAMAVIAWIIARTRT